MDTGRKEFDEARKCMRRLRSLRGTRVTFNRTANRFYVTLSDDKTLIFSPDENPVLATARVGDLAAVELSPSGLGLYWPRLDVDIYIPELLERAVTRDDPDGTSGDARSARGSRTEQRLRAVKSARRGRQSGRSVAA